MVPLSIASVWETNPHGTAYFKNPSTGEEIIYLVRDNGSGSNSSIYKYDINGSKTGTISVANARNFIKDITVDEYGTIYLAEYAAVTCLANDGTFKWRTGRNASITNFGSVGSGDAEFNYADGITIGPDGNLYIADRENHRIQVLDKNGSFVRKFGSNGTAPGQMRKPQSVSFYPNGNLMITDQYYVHWFKPNGDFLKVDKTVGKRTFSAISKDGLILTGHGNYNCALYVFGDTSTNHTYFPGEYQGTRFEFTQHGDVLFTANAGWGDWLRFYKKAYRTKGLPQRNVIPQPAIRKISQRSGTNVLDLDFEIIDSDDTNATVGIIAYAENARVVPQAWTDGTGSKIGTPIATNEVHRVSWDVKQDWNTSTGTIKFEILCQDGRTNKPVDIHFLTLPLADGNLTISRSPIKDADIENYLKYLVAIGSNEVAYENSTITNGSGTIYLNASKQATAQGQTFFMTKLGHRWATSTEVNNAKIAATPGTTNTWAASRPVSPRGLPKNVNEYGFDTGNHGTRAWWVVKQ